MIDQVLLHLIPTWSLGLRFGIEAEVKKILMLRVPGHMQHPKMRNGKITKVIVTKSGAGYIDPIAIVRDAPPKHITTILRMIPL